MLRIDILKINQLNEQQISDVRELEQVCQLNDGLKGTLFLSNEINFNQDIDSFYLLYDNTKLVSFLLLFIPTATEAEISAYTLPTCRKQGHFKALLEKAIAELKNYDINKILFAYESCSADAKYALESYHTEYSFSEYVLTYNPSDFSKIDSRLRLELVSESLIPDVAALDCKVFESEYEYEESLSMITKSFKSDTIKPYCAFLNDELVGTCGINLDGGEVYIFGVGICPDFQGKGYGKEMLHLLLEQIILNEHGKIKLEVNSKNKAAYQLYIKAGFQIETQFDYDTYLL